MTLAAGEKGKSYIVGNLDDLHEASRIREMGLIPGIEVKVLFHAPFGDPIAVEVGSMVICLRKHEADQIKINLK